MGYASPAFQDAAGKYHLEGAVELAPSRSLRVIAGILKELVEVSGAARVILLLPLPRYVKESCCSTNTHVTNINATSYHEMLSSAAHVVKNIVDEELKDCGKQLLCLSPLAGFGNDSLADCKSSDGESIWHTGDPVHLTAAAYNDITALVRHAGGQRGNRGNFRGNGWNPARRDSSSGGQGRRGNSGRGSYNFY
jgi:hypothetical protein